MKNLLLKISAISMVILITAIPALAQGAPPATPIDGGLGLLLAGAAAYGIKKLKEKRK